jgi:ribosomal protein S18 acetylase RimI-like enzyme
MRFDSVMNLTFKYYEETDFNDLYDMIFCLYEEDPLGEPMADTKIRNTIHESVSHPEKVRIVMICDDGKNVGYGIIVLFWSNEHGGNIINIDELYVKKEYRNRQIATNFIKHQMSAHKNAKMLQLETTPSNAAAFRLYERLGFEPAPNCHMILHLCM